MCTLIAAVMIFSQVSVFQALSNPLEQLPVFVLIVVVLCAAVFSFICCFITTVVTVTKHELTIELRPLQVKKKREFPQIDIAQIFVSYGKVIPSHRRGRRREDLEFPVLQLMTTEGNNYPILKGRDARDFPDFEALRERFLQVLNIELVNYVS